MASRLPLLAVLLVLALVPPAGARTVGRVGIMYEGWHAPAVQGLLDQDKALVVEDILKSKGKLSFADMHRGMNLSAAWSFHFHAKPKLGFYCMYRKREGEPGVLPDCDNITGTATEHAALLSAAKVDFVVLDSTNFQSFSPHADAIQLRPAEVLFEEFYKLRRQGVVTPQIAAWQNIQDPTGDLWMRFADGVYANATYQKADLLMRDAHTGKYVFFVTKKPDPTILARLQQKFAVVEMWAEFGPPTYDQGLWGFFSPCVYNGSLSTTVYNLDGPPCAQPVTHSSPIGPTGTALTVGPSYQLSYSSLPFMAASKLGGLTLKKQFATAFANSVDYLFVGTFNEHIAQPQHNHFATLPAISMGLEDDAFNTSLWVDMYGNEIARDLEPTEQDGGALWALFRSCMRVYQSGADSCDEPAEPCCVNSGYDAFEHVWSLRLVGGRGTLLTNSSHERAVLVAGGGWAEVCTPFGGSTAFCKGGPSVTAASYNQGPFLLYAEAWPNTAAVHRCITADGVHFIAPQASCFGLGHQESTLGFAATNQSSQMARPLRACRHTATQAFYHSVDRPCLAGDHQLAMLGYVR